MEFKSLYCRAAGQAINLVNGLAVCYCDARPTGQCMKCDKQALKANIIMFLFELSYKGFKSSICLQSFFQSILIQIKATLYLYATFFAGKNGTANSLCWES